MKPTNSTHLNMVVLVSMHLGVFLLIAGMVGPFYPVRVTHTIYVYINILSILSMMLGMAMSGSSYALWKINIGQ